MAADMLHGPEAPPFLHRSQKRTNSYLSGLLRRKWGGVLWRSGDAWRVPRLSEFAQFAIRIEATGLLDSLMRVWQLIMKSSQKHMSAYPLGIFQRLDGVQRARSL